MKVITIGRSSQNDISVNDPKVSRHHCQIVQYDNGTFGIVDFGSKNGTFVNGQRVYGEVQLMWGDRVQIAQANLPWQQYFSAGTAKRKKRWLWPTIVGIVAIVVATVVMLLAIRWGAWYEKDILFSGAYPPVTQVIYEQDGNIYTVEAVQGQVMVYFADGVSHREAVRAIKKAGGKVAAQIPKAHYYLVSTDAEEESAFMQKIRTIAATDFVYPNAVSYTCEATSYVMDDFTDKSDGATHGEIVSYALQECGHVATIRSYEENVDGSGLKWSEIIKDLNNILSNASEDVSPVINMSFGVALRVAGKDVFWEDAPDSIQYNYRQFYIKEIKLLLEQIDQYRDKNFVIVKSTGNSAIKNFDKDILTPLYNTLDEKQRAVMDEHVILVAAEDSRNRAYSNELEKGVHHNWVTKVDISDFKFKGKNAYGTSYAAPRTTCFISTTSEKFKLKPTDVLQYVRKATEKAPDHILTLERLEKEIAGEPNNAKLSENEAVIEGVLKMYLLDNMSDGSTTYYTDTEGNVEYVSVEEKGSYSQVINKYRNTSENEYIAFVVETDNKIDVKQYLSDDDLELFDKTVQSEFMVVPNFQFSGEHFAAKYANKRVRVKGTLYVPMAGWRNVTDVVMNLSEIMLVDNSEKKTTKTEKNIVSSSHQGIPSSLVGTMWVTNQTHNNWTGEKRTIEFVGEYQVRITDEVLFYLMSTSDNLPEPTVRLYNCYYDAKEDRIFICKNSNQVISNMTMRLKYERGQLIETTNKYSMVEYDRLR